jgi:hypothetical protein
MNSSLWELLDMPSYLLKKVAVLCVPLSCQVICTFMKVLFLSIKTSILGLHQYVVSITVLLILCHDYQNILMKYSFQNTLAFEKSI